MKRSLCLGMKCFAVTIVRLYQNRHVLLSTNSVSYIGNI